jgi:hypothetical protein
MTRGVRNELTTPPPDPYEGRDLSITLFILVTEKFSYSPKSLANTKLMQRMRDLA